MIIAGGESKLELDAGLLAVHEAGSDAEEDKKSVSTVVKTSSGRAARDSHFVRLGARRGRAHGGAQRGDGDEALRVEEVGCRQSGVGAERTGTGSHQDNAAGSACRRGIDEIGVPVLCRGGRDSVS